MNKTTDRVVGKPTRYQKNKIKKGKLLNQRFKFKKDDFEEEVKPQIRIVSPEEFQEAVETADKINLFTGGNTIELPEELHEAVKQEWVDASRDDGFIISVEDGVLTSRVMTDEEQKEHTAVFTKGDMRAVIDEMHVQGSRPEHYDSDASKMSWPDGLRLDETIMSVEEPTEEGKLAVRAMTDEEQKEHSILEPIVPPVINPSDIIREKLMQRYNDLVIELAMVVADRIKTFKKRNPIMAKLTGEDHGFIEESSWTTGETTTFKYWPAGWRFERLIGTNIIFEARFNHTTFELMSYCTVFIYDPKTNPTSILSRNKHEYSLGNVDDLQGIIAIYEKAIDFVNRKARR